MTAHKAKILRALYLAHKKKLLPADGVTAQQIAGGKKPAAATSRELRILEAMQYVKGHGWPKYKRKYLPTLKGLRSRMGRE